jgi:hypothetical protein
MRRQLQANALNSPFVVASTGFATSFSGLIPAVPFDGHCRANLASWLVRCRASPSKSVGFGIVDGRRLCFPLSLPLQPTPDHTHAPGRSEPYGRGGQDTTAHGDPERALVVPSEGRRQLRSRRMQSAVKCSTIESGCPASTCSCIAREVVRRRTQHLLPLQAIYLERPCSCPSLPE